MTFQQIQTPVQEVGHVRFKIAAAATFGAETPSITIPGGSSTSLDELATSLASQPTAQNFASTLLDLAPHPSFAVTSWARLDTVFDSDWCFFRVAITLPTDELRRQVGSQHLAVSAGVSLMFGPSRAAWLAIAMRLGPQFGVFEFGQGVQVRHGHLGRRRTGGVDQRVFKASSATRRSRAGPSAGRTRPCRTRAP